MSKKLNHFNHKNFNYKRKSIIHHALKGLKKSPTKKSPKDKRKEKLLSSIKKKISPPKKSDKLSCIPLRSRILAKKVSTKKF